MLDPEGASDHPATLVCLFRDLLLSANAQNERWCAHPVRHSACFATWMSPAPKRLQPPRWNDWTTRRLVQFHYEGEAVSRAVRLTDAGTRVGEGVRVGMSGVEVEGRITEINGTILRVELSAHGAKKKMAKAAPRPRQPRRVKAG